MKHIISFIIFLIISFIFGILGCNESNKSNDSFLTASEINSTNIAQKVHLIKLNSSAIEGVKYFPNKQYLDIIFTSGTTYRYFSVPEGVFHGLISAPSAGLFFQDNIKDIFHFERL